MVGFFPVICFQAEMFDPSVYYEKANIPSITMGEFFYFVWDILFKVFKELCKAEKLCDVDWYHFQTLTHFTK